MSQSIDSVSSVGAVWPPIVSSNERLKGFYESPVETPASTEAFVADFEAHVNKAKDNSSTSRLSIRLITTASTLAVLSEAGITVEGALPIRGEQDRFMVYTAWNSDERTVPADTLQQHSDLLQGVTMRPQSVTDAAANLVARGFTAKIIDRFTPERTKRSLVARFTDLYGVFGYDEGDVETIFGSPNNTIAYVEDATGIVSTAMAERASVPVEDFGELEVVEITEAITRPDQRGKGLYAGVSGVLNAGLLASDDLPHIIYGESNLAAPGVLKAAHQNGRRFNHFDAADLGHTATGFGVLQQSFKVEDGVEQRPFNDFALSYVPLG